MNALRTWYAGLQDRERQFVALGSVGVLVMVLIFGVFLPLHAAVSSARKSNETKRTDLAWMQHNAPEVRAAEGRFAADSGEPAMVLVDRLGRELGLADALRGTAPNGAGVRVQLESAPFDLMVAWLAALDERYGLAVESITVDRAAKPGVVNANITLAQSHH